MSLFLPAEAASPPQCHLCCPQPPAQLSQVCPDPIRALHCCFSLPPFLSVCKDRRPLQLSPVRNFSKRSQGHQSTGSGSKCTVILKSSPQGPDPSALLSSNPVHGVRIRVRCYPQTLLQSLSWLKSGGLCYTKKSLCLCCFGNALVHPSLASLRASSAPSSLQTPPISLQSPSSRIKKKKQKQKTNEEATGTSRFGAREPIAGAAQAHLGKELSDSSCTQKVETACEPRIPGSTRLETLQAAMAVRSCRASSQPTRSSSWLTKIPFQPFWNCRAGQNFRNNTCNAFILHPIESPAQPGPRGAASSQHSQVPKEQLLPESCIDRSLRSSFFLSPACHLSCDSCVGGHVIDATPLPALSLAKTLFNALELSGWRHQLHDNQGPGIQDPSVCCNQRKLNPPHISDMHNSHSAHGH
ncbi:uncharacterized protein LOC107983958 [Homo sapiens]|uniref:uncharacterized protein LOC107983958 n=1 Tax=Homo sapiens TaxID=9606 RepID=UPI0005CFFAB2|nr:uncharacterized protein LOC107983958 [Homo sapiens]|eukprot:XP_016876375.1 uncharacterized protein LOC107983958 [Homo sapiens]